MIDVHRREAALVVMGVPKKQLPTAMRRAECVVVSRISCVRGLMVAPA
jgi:hypothetical protein